MLTDRELDIMTILWERGSATASEVRDALEDQLAYNTVQTMLSILEEKSHVRHEAEGRAFRFYPQTKRKTAARVAVKRMIKTVFAGSPRLLVTDLVRDRSLTVADLQELRALLDQQLRERERP